MIDFANASLLGYDHTSRFFGDSTFRYGIEKNITVEGFIDNLFNQNGVSGTLSGVRQFIASANDFNDIILKGINYGKGRVNSISFDDGNWVKLTNYTANITILSSGDLYNMTGTYYSGVKAAFYDLSNNLNLLDTIEETFDFDVDADNQWSSNRSINIKYLSGDSTNPFNRAKSLAYQLFAAPVPFGFVTTQFSGYYNSPAKKYYTETYNQIDYSCSFNQRFSLNENSGYYSLIKTNSIETDELGVSKVTEEGTIQGLIGNRFLAACSGYDQELINVYPRCLEVFNAYKPQNANPLTNQFIEKGVNSNQFEGSLSYSVKFSNDPSILSGYSWEYRNSLSLSNEQIYTVSENGNVVGFGKLGSPEKFNKAVSGYGVVKAGIVNRCYDVYISKANPNGTFKKVSTSYSEAKYRGTIGYSTEYSDDPSYINDSVILKAITSVEKVKPIHIFEKYNIPNYKQIIQNGYQTNLSRDSVSINLNLQPNQNMTSNNVDYCLNYCLGILANTKSSAAGSDKFVSDVSYSIDELNKTFSFNASVNHVIAVDYNNLDLNWP